MSRLHRTSAASNLKRLILFFDGTWLDVLDESNVYLLAKNVASYGPDGKRQKFFYSPGVGNTVLSKIPGGIAGIGLQDNLIEGYEWLCRNYDDGDEIWIFGFSRGAYTARSLAGLIRKCGLLFITNPATLHASLALYRNKTFKAGPFLEPASGPPRDVRPDETTAVAFRSRFSRDVTIDFLGIWDTVGALGIPFAGRFNNRFRWHDTQLSKIVRRGYHALAIDEHRAAFNATPWVDGESRAQLSTSSPREVEQRWFIGSHGDIGGGCEDPTLSTISLAWMQTKATQAGLGLRHSGVEVSPNAYKGPIFPSYERFANGVYKLAHELPWIGKGRYHRSVMTRMESTAKGEQLVINPCIDPSVLSRWNSDSSYRPMGLGDIQNHIIRRWDEPSFLGQ